MTEYGRKHANLFVPLQAVHPGDLIGSEATCPSALSTGVGVPVWQSNADADQHGASWILNPAVSIQKI